MTGITDEQVEAAAIAICVAQRHTGDRECEKDHEAARAALEAATPAPVVDVEKLEEALRASWEPARVRPGVSIKLLAELSADYLNGGAK